MAEKKAYSRDDCEFVSPAGILGFPKLEPGTAKAITSQDAKDKQGGYTYGLELTPDDVPMEGPDSGMYKTVRLIASHEDPARIEMHLFGRDGAFPRLNAIEMPKRDLAVYPYAINKHMIGFSNVYYPDTVGMQNLDLSNPEDRKTYDAAIAGKAPGVVKFCDINNPFEVQRVEEKNKALRMAGQPAIPEADYWKTIIRLYPNEYWPGCIVKVAGRAYWSKRHKNVALAFTHVQFIKEGPRLIGGEKSPDQVFKPCEPSPSMAPPPPPMPVAAGWDV